MNSLHCNWLALGLFALLSGLPGAYASDFELVEDLVPSAQSTSDWGQLHHLDGDNRLLVSHARYGGQPEPEVDCGSVIVLDRGGDGRYTEAATLTAADVDGSCKAGDMFGIGIDIFGDLLFISAPAGMLEGTEAVSADGAVYVYERDNSLASGWRGVARVNPQGLPAGKGFGLHVRGNADWLAVQQNRYESIFGFRFFRSEAVYLFRRNGADASSWSQVKVFDTNRAYFGYNFEFSGDDLLIGAPETVQAVQQGPGRVYVHRRNAGGANSWGQVQELSVSGDTNFGFVMSVDGDRLAVSSINIARKGSAHIFERDAAGSWSRTQTLRANPGQDNDVYGSGIALRGDTLVVAAQNGRDVQATRGRAHVYRRAANGQFAETQILQAPDSTRNDHFGNHLSLGDTVLIAASPGATVNGDRAGLFHFQRGFDGGFNVDAGISGLWFDTARDGEGFSVEILSASEALLIWYTYDLDGSQMWLLGIAEIDGASLIVDSLLRPVGARFGENFDPGDVDRQVWGSMRMDFESCDAGQFSYQGPAGFGSGSHSLSRLGQMAGVACGGSAQGTSATRLSGHFYDASRNGEGFSLQMLESGGTPVPVTYWFTYTPGGEQAWMIGIGELQGQRIVVDEVLQPIGAQFGAAFNPADVERLPWGEWSMDFSNCNTAALTYTSLLPGYTSVAQSLQRLSLPAGIDCPTP